MLKFYLNNEEVNVECNASFTSQVGAFDSGSCSLEFSNLKNCILPNTPFRIEDDETNDIWNFIISQDIVSIAERKKGQMSYKHDLTLTSYNNILSRRIVRNTKFTQPLNSGTKTRVSCFGSLPQNYNADGTLSSFSKNLEIVKEYNNVGVNLANYYYHKKFTIKPREKVLSVIIEPEVFVNVADTYLFNPPIMRYTGWKTEWLRATLNVAKLILHRYENNVETNAKEIIIVGNRKIEIVGDNFFENSTKATSYEITIDPLTTIQIANPTTLSALSITKGSGGASATKHYNIVAKIDFRVSLNTCYYTLWDMLNILQLQTQKNEAEPIYIMPNKSIGNGKILNSIVAPEMNFVSQDLFSCVAQILQYIDAFPTLNEENGLGFEYLNNNAKTPIEIGNRIADESKKLTEQYFTNKIVADYQNARQKLPVYYPAKKTFCRVGCSNLGVATASDYVLKTDKPIDYLSRAYIDTTNISFTYQYHLFDYPSYTDVTISYESLKISNNILDITECVYEQSEYALLTMSQVVDYATSNNQFPTQFNTVYYSRGGKEIYVGAITDIDGTSQQKYIFRQVIAWASIFYFGGQHSGAQYSYIEGGLVLTKNIPHITSISGLGTMQPNEIKYNIEYYSIFDGRVAVERTENKYNGETFVTQSSASVELNKMGSNMSGLVAKMGNEEKSITIDTTPYGSRIKKGSLWVDEDGNKYFANIVKTTFSTNVNHCIVETQFSKNFNLLSQYTSIDQEKRFYEISDGLTSKGNEVYVEYLYFSTEDNRTLNEEICANINCINTIASGILKGTKYASADISFLRTKENTTDTSNVDLGVENRTEINTESINIPLHVYGCGNMICFEMSYNHQLAAMDRFGEESVEVTQGQYTNSLINHSTIYCSNSGFADLISLYVFTIDSEKMKFDDKFPLLNSVGVEGSAQTLIEIVDFPYYKKENETLSINYEIALLPYNNEEIYFGSKFIDENAIIPHIIESNDEIYLYVGLNDTHKYSLTDKKALGIKLDNSVLIDIDNRDISIEINALEESYTNVVSYCLADKLGNILIAVNKKIPILNGGDILHLYYFTHKTRI